ncbi:MAG: ankyrin repeat domain-containing protein [Cyanobacteria bacterium P01_D01_bin.14]
MQALDSYLKAGGNLSGYVGRSPLIMCATEWHSYEVVRELIELDVDLDAPKETSWWFPFAFHPDADTTALQTAVLNDNFEIAELLFRNGADANYTKDPGTYSSPFNLALGSGQREILELFLEAGSENYTLEEEVISVAIGGRIEVFRVLLKIDMVDEEVYERALETAKRRKHADIVNLLKSEGIGID